MREVKEVDLKWVRMRKLPKTLAAACLLFLSGFTAAEETTSLDTAKVQLENGVVLNYIEKGTGTPVIFIHGTLGDLSMWHPFVESFGEDFRAIAYSRRYNYPNKNRIRKDENHSTAIEAADLADFIRTLKLQKAHIVGYSYGGYTALHLAVNHPELVRSLVVAEPPLLPWLEDMAENREQGKRMLELQETRFVKPAREALSKGDEAGAIRIFIDYVIKDGAFDNWPEEVKKAHMRNAPEFVAEVMSKNMFAPLTRQQVAKLPIPTLMLSGEDSIGPLKLTDDELEKVLPKSSKRVVIPNATHGMWYENPEACSRALQNFFRGGEEARVGDGQFHIVRVESPSLENNLLGDSQERNVSLYLPPGYGAQENADLRYPVLYLLHGYTGDNTLWTGGSYIENLDLAAIATDLIESGKIQPMLIVAPDCSNAYRGSWYTNSAATGNWEDFIVKDLVHFIDANYRTLSKRNSRGLAGHSMGGHGALKLAMKHPKLFNSVYGMSPAWIDFEECFRPPWIERVNQALAVEDKAAFDDLHWRAQAFIALAAAVSPSLEPQPFYAKFPVDRTGKRNIALWKTWQQQDPLTMLKTHAEALKSFETVAIDCGTQEDLLPMNISFTEALKKEGVPHSFEKFEGDHVNRVADQLRTRVLPLFSSSLVGQTRGLEESVSQ